MTILEAKTIMEKIRGVNAYKNHNPVSFIKKKPRISNEAILAYQESMDKRLAYERELERYYAQMIDT